MSFIEEKKIRELQRIGYHLREHVIEMIVAAGSGHPGGSLGMADIFAALYFHVLKHDPTDPNWSERDRLVLSNGHICPIRYAAMAEAGYFDAEQLKKLRQFGSPLQGHPERGRLPGLETSSGPLGAGLAQAAGMALAAKMNKEPWRTFCITSDGEHDAGLHWEAVMFAAAKKLDNLICIVDRNRIQLDGPTEEIMPLQSLKEKYESFGWTAIDINGHDIAALVEAIGTAPETIGRPTVIVANTVLGSGVSFMENDYRWHGQAPNAEQGERALVEIRRHLAEIERIHRDRFPI